MKLTVSVFIVSLLILLCKSAKGAEPQVIESMMGDAKFGMTQEQFAARFQSDCPKATSCTAKGSYTFAGAFGTLEAFFFENGLTGLEIKPPAFVAAMPADQTLPLLTILLGSPSASYVAQPIGGGLLLTRVIWVFPDRSSISVRLVYELAGVKESTIQVSRPPIANSFSLRPLQVH